MIPFIKRLRRRLDLVRHSNEELERRVVIENYLLHASCGKKPLPSKNTCLVLANVLGTPAPYMTTKRAREILRECEANDRREEQ